MFCVYTCPPPATCAECLCGPGFQFERDSSKPQGFKHVNCKPCTGKNEYMDLVMHDHRQCKLCPAALRPTTDRSACGEECLLAPSDQHAVLAPVTSRKISIVPSASYGVDVGCVERHPQSAAGNAQHKQQSYPYWAIAKSSDCPAPSSPPSSPHYHS
jgi:hypothetical protein